MTKRKTILGIPYEILFSGNITMPVVFPFGKWTWKKVIGIQIGDWFIGGIKGTKDVV